MRCVCEEGRAGTDCRYGVYKGSPLLDYDLLGYQGLHGMANSTLHSTLQQTGCPAGAPHRCNATSCVASAGECIRSFGAWDAIHADQFTSKKLNASVQTSSNPGGKDNVLGADGF